MSRRPEQVARPKWVGMTVETSRLFPYGSCDTHTKYLSKREARQSARRHADDVSRGDLGCRKCDRGMTMNPFRCPVNPRHFHAGHAWRNASRRNEP